MTAATLTRPTTTATTPQAPRACWWQIRPEGMADGRLLGYVGLRVGKAKDWYRVVRESIDDMEQIWTAAKELNDGTFAEPYTVRLPASPTATPVCSCPGHRYQGACRHSKTLVALTRKAQ